MATTGATPSERPRFSSSDTASRSDTASSSEDASRDDARAVPAREAEAPLSPPALGVTLPQFTSDADVFLDAARRAEDLGLDSVWVFDHIWPLTGARHRPAIECWTALSWLAAATERIAIGTLVTRSSLRHPAVLAKMAATVAEIAPGRLTIGIGSGDEASRPENEAYGIAYHPGDDRIRQLEATVESLARLLAGETVSMRSPFARLTDMALDPSPARRPRLWVGGRSDAVLALAARRADGWNAWGSSPQRFASDGARLAAAAGERRVEATWGGVAILGSTAEEARAKLGRRSPRGYVVGAPPQLASHLEALHAAGASHLILTFPDAGAPGPYELLATEVRSLLIEMAGRGGGG
jgi:alkanesulfonate monooxygenase SsuD/methylene tetrahydromethanopterin reductase-like flavin-dependent oxidoreductase (luciferase family)